MHLMNWSRRLPSMVVIFLVLFGWVQSAGAQNESGQESVQQEPGELSPAETSVPDRSTPSVGVPTMIEQKVLPGSLLTHKPVDPKESDMVVRVVRSFPHGDAFRYDISYYGMEPGQYDLRDYLVRVDGSPTDDLPAIPVTVQSILDAGQITPNDLDIGGLSRFGGYWRMVWIGGFIWIAVLLGFIFLGRRRVEEVENQHTPPPTLAELLRPSIASAIAGELPHEKHAELERLLFSFWQKRLKLDSLPPAEAIHQVREHEESGPLMKRIEESLHAPATGSDHDLAQLLKPMESISADEFAEHQEFSNTPGEQTDD